MNPFLLASSLLSILGMTLCYSADSGIPERAEKSYQAASAVVMRQYQTEVAKLLKELEKSKSEETKAGKLQTALAVDGLIKEVLAGKILKDALEAPGLDSLQNSKSTTAVPITSPEKYIIGTWIREDKRCTFGFFNDGNVHISWGDKPWKVGDRPDATGTWEINKHEGFLRITYCGEYSDITLPLVSGGNKITDKNKVETVITKK